MDLVAWAYSVAEDQLAGSLPRRWAHVQGVAMRAEEARGLFVGQDQELLTAAAVLHDVGYAPDLALTGFHPLDGARYLDQQGFPERLCALVAHHSFACREAELRGLSAELASWEDEKSAVRDALWWADMTTSPDGQVTTVVDRLAEIHKRYGPDDIVTMFIGQAEPELVAAAERTEKRLRAIGRG
ncbi:MULTISPECIES: HD domain-containing protein [Saccharothrix]|uniref:HD domain-containing protein n=1 Tax=Saccharothrix TaxID=2071 RepID=UPI00093983F7|nr:HD domain-containing protein [Saccharothrix sp. CB00851]OKI21404.1 phosphohydrolase [Saccharothrix sp. CB00851]